LTGRYLHATLAEIAFAVATRTGETHPLADRRRRPGRDSLSTCARR
jgi:hypothetical protein